MSWFEKRLDKKERYEREEMIQRIEGLAGTMRSVPWSKISTEDLRKLFSMVVEITHRGLD